MMRMVFLDIENCFYHLAISSTRPTSSILVGGFAVLYASTYLERLDHFVLCDSPSSSPRVVVSSYTVVISIIKRVRFRQHQNVA
jgi:hypothetical protein